MRHDRDGGTRAENVSGKTDQSELLFTEKPKNMPKGEAVMLCSCTKGFVLCCFVFLLVWFCPSVCLEGELECAVMGCPPRWRGTGVPSSGSGVG